MKTKLITWTLRIVCGATVAYVAYVTTPKKEAIVAETVTQVIPEPVAKVEPKGTVTLIPAYRAEPVILEHSYNKVVKSEIGEGEIRHTGFEPLQIK